MMKKNADQAIGFVLLVFAAVAARLWFRDIPNFAPVAAVALFAGYAFRSTAWAIAVPLAVMMISDQIIGGYETTVMVAVYASLIAPVFFRGVLRRNVQLDGSRSVVAEMIGLVSCALAASVLFFVATNFAVWATWYKADPRMLVPCYVQAIPFFRYTLLGDLSFATALFGGYAMCARALRQRGARLVATSA
ncbi:DUF6580 family putative transport protein [Planctomycetota bacterium]